VLVSLPRQFALGSLLPVPPDGARGWTLPQVVERMRRAYCGTLAVELDHLYSSVSLSYTPVRVFRRNGTRSIN